jgi:hypothetical protein
MMTKTIITFFLIIIAFSKIYGQSIIGFTTDQNEKEAEPFVSINLYRSDSLVSKVISDIDGKFLFKKLIEGDYIIVAEQTGCKSDTARLNLKTEKEYTVKIKLTCERIICKVIYSDSSFIDFNVNSLMVADFIKYIRLNDKSSYESKILTIKGQAKSGWITLNDILFLMPLIHSKEEAKCIWTEISSVHPHYSFSTIGGQAMNLIDSYRFAKHYPFFLQDCSSNDKNRVDDITKWWNQLNK